MTTARISSDRESRRLAILRCVREQAVRNQAELSALLRAQGIRVNQATLSRDLRDMGLLKGRSGYELPGESLPAPDDPGMALYGAVHGLLTRIDRAQNMIVLHTRVGAAAPLAVALDQAGWRELLGTIAGDDTVLAVCKSAEHARRVARQLSDLKERRRK